MEFFLDHKKFFIALKKLEQLIEQGDAHKTLLFLEEEFENELALYKHDLDFSLRHKHD